MHPSEDTRRDPLEIRGDTPNRRLATGCDEGDFKEVNAALGEGANVHESNERPIRWAAGSTKGESKGSSLTIVELLLERGSFVHEDALIFARTPEIRRAMVESLEAGNQLIGEWFNPTSVMLTARIRNYKEPYYKADIEALKPQASGPSSSDSASCPRPS
jgi:hypothetical protein